MIRFACLLLVFVTNAQASDIEFWHSMGGAKGRLVATLADDFNREHPTWPQIRAQYVGTYEDGLNKLRSAVLAHREPHLVQITDVGTQLMIDSGRVVPLQDLIDHDPTFPQDQMLPALRRYYEVKGRLFSLPFATSNPVLYYDADALKAAGIEHAPKTFAELEAAAKALTNEKDHIRGVTWPLDSWFLEEFVALQGEELFDHNNGRDKRAEHANYLSRAALTFVSLWTRMVKDGSFDNVGRGWDPAEQNFLARRTRMLITSSSDVMEVEKEVSFRLGVAPAPGVQAGGGTVVGGNSLWIMKDKPADEQRVSYEFVKFMASAPVQERWHINTGYFPIRRDVIAKLRAEGFYAKHPGAEVTIAQMERVPDTGATAGARIGAFNEAREHVMTAIEEALAGRFSVREALKKAQAKTDSSLKRYNAGQP